MNFQPRRTNFGFGSQITSTGKNLLFFYGGIYILELLFEHWLKFPVVRYFVLFPFASEFFHIWQILTHPFLHDPSAPISFLINCLVFYFFASPVELTFGTKRFLVLFYIAAVGSAICGLLFSSVSGFSAPFMGMMPSLLALIVVFGLINPEATILLMFILPVKAKYLSYGTILITVLTFLAKANPYGAYHLGGILFGYIYFKGPKDIFDPNLWYLKYLQWQYKRKKRRFTVVDGDRKKDEDKPTYH